MLYRLALKNLRRNPRRTTSILATVGIGLGALLIMGGFNAGNMNSYRENIVHSQYGHGRVQSKGYLDKVWEKPSEQWIVDWRDVANELKKQSGMRDVFPRVSFSGLISSGNRTLGVIGQGVDAQAEDKFFNRLDLINGKKLSEVESGVILGNGIASNLGLKPGDTVTVLTHTVEGSMNGLDLVVAGVFQTGRKDFDDGFFRMHLSDAHALLDTTKVESIALGLNDFEQWKDVEREVENRLPKLEAVSLSKLDKVYFQNAMDWLEMQYYVIQLIVLSIVLLGIFNSVSTGILERRQEFGNLRANGESNRNILELLAWEGALLGVCGAIAGLVLAGIVKYTFLRNGILMPPTPGLTLRFFVPIDLEPNALFVNSTLSFVATSVATILAGIRITRTSISSLLRSP